tara:strand:- start:989 stop:1603 length:615 start_codon:yes stop_codon:yes gene_type:complete
MVLFHDEIGHQSHKVRIVLSEKGISADLEALDPENIPKEILEVNPKGFLPLLLDRELALYKSQLIVEYLDERFPHPPLLPVYPVSRAQTRLILHRIEEEWTHHLDILEDTSSTTSKKNSSRKELKKNITNSMMLFDGSEYFRSDEFSVLDATIIPILIRLKFLGVDIPNNKSTKNMHEYTERMIENELVQNSLTLREKESFFTD